jgi:hypothetical protein
MADAKGLVAELGGETDGLIGLVQAVMGSAEFRYRK